VPPNNKVDLVTLMHDVDYGLANTPMDAWKADWKAIKNSDATLVGTAVRTGLLTRSLITPTLFYGSNKQPEFIEAKHYVKTNDYWNQQINKYGMNNEFSEW